MIEDALSATIWPATACEHLFIGPRARIGAAVAFHKNNTSGAAEVDAKLNSAIAAELATIAEARGRSSLLIRAMILPEVEVYVHPGSDGKLVLSDTKPNDADSTWKCLSDKVGVLTLTGKEANTYGLAKLVPGTDLEFVRKALGVESWTSAGTYAAELMKDGARKAESIRDRAAKLNTEAAENAAKYKSNRPENFRYTVTPNGQMTPESQHRWREATDNATNALSKLRQGLIQWLELKKQAKAAGCEGLVADDFGPKELGRTTEAIEKLLTDLRKNRNRTTLPPDFNPPAPAGGGGGGKAR